MARFRLALIAFAFLAFLGTSVRAEGGGEAAKKADGGAKSEPKKKKPEIPTIEDATKDTERIDGVFTLYKKKDRLLALIPNDKLDKPMLLATSIAGGGFFTGWQWSDMMIRFRRQDKQVLVLRPDTQHVTGEKGPISASVERTHPGYLVGAVPILGADSQKGVVVDLTKLYVNQAESFVGSLAKQRDPSLARLRKVKNFPKNAEVSVDLVARPRGFKHGDILTVHYSLSTLPESDYTPRMADDRVGYFLTVVRDYTKDYRDDTTFVRYANRWRLEKAEPDLELSPPKEPIIFYIEKTVPTRYRRWVRAGIEEWNRAFEKIGYTGAIEVRQQTETQFADLDPEDVRYNFFRWITSDASFAMGPSRVDPRTGQILDADIIFDDSMLRAYMDDWDLMVEEAMSESMTHADAHFLKENPSWDPATILRRSLPADPERAERLARRETLVTERPGTWHRHPEPPGSGRMACSLGRGRARQMALASLQMDLIGMAEDDSKDGDEGKKEREWPEEFIGQVIVETVMHEVGHTIGLRHNFKASTWRTLEEMNPSDGEAPDLTASVMDYNPLNVAPEGEKQGVYQMTTIGPYDYWAVEFGYSDAKGDELDAIAARGAEDGHDYGTDEDVGFGDPLINRWDFGADPLNYTRARVELCHHLKDVAIDRVVKDGGSHATARRAIDTLLGTLGYASQLAALQVGGTYFHRDHKGDPGARDPIVPVPAEKQREALHLLRDNLFAPDAFELDPELFNKLAPSRWSHWGNTQAWYAEAAYPFHDRLLSMQAWSLYRLLSPVTLRRVFDTEVATAAGEDALTIPELFEELSTSIFAELEAGPSGRFTNREPFLSNARRNLQREYVARLIDLTLQSNGGWHPQAARTQAWYELKQLGSDLNRLLDGGGAKSLDDYSRAHLEEARERIARALDASFELTGG